MKHKILIVSVMVASLALPVMLGFSSAKHKKHRVVFEVSSGTPEVWQAVLNNVENVQKSFGKENSEIEVVMHGKGLGLILNSNEAMSERLKTISQTGAVFAACENTMRRMNVKKEDLMPFAITVNSGVAEVVRKQEAGWSYIKAGS